MSRHNVLAAVCAELIGRLTFVMCGVATRSTEAARDGANSFAADWE